MTDPQHAQSRDRGKLRPVSIVESPELVAHTDAIRSLGKQTIANVISIGEHLTECKRIVGHGGFADFLMREFRWTGRHARRFMQVSEASKTENFSDLNLPVSVFYLLAAPSTPEPVREEIITRAGKGEKIKVADVKGAIRVARPAKKATKTAPAAAAAQTMPGSIGPMLPPPPTTTEQDPFPDYPDLPVYLDRRPAGPSIEERYRTLEIEAIGLRSEIEELRLENEHLKRENAELRQGLNPAGTADADDAQVEMLLAAMPAIDKKLN